MTHNKRTKKQLHHFTVDLFATFDPTSDEGALFLKDLEDDVDDAIFQVISGHDMERHVVYKIRAEKVK